MRGEPHPYDRELYGRAFLNCYQRQSLVMLAPKVPALPDLFGACLVSTDDIVEQVVRRQRPKYDFESAFFGQDDLRRVGLVQHEVPFDDFASARNAVLDAIRDQGFALVVVDVYYLPHCPEYRKQHVVHTIVLTGYDADTGHWTVVDDNPASVLCVYAYADDVVTAAYDNGVLRRVRTFTTTGDGAAPDSLGVFFERVEHHVDSRALFGRVDEIAQNPWIAPDVVIRVLHDAFSLYQGSRVCLSAYLRHALGDVEADTAVANVVTKAGGILNALLIAKVTGALDVEPLRAACADLGGADEDLVSGLRKLGADR